MSYEFKKLSEVEALTEVPEGAKVLAEANGKIVRVPGSGLGGGSGSEIPKPLTYDYMPQGYPSKAYENATLIEEQSVVLQDAGEIRVGSVDATFDIQEGENYTVYLDGVEYASVAKNDGGRLYIGNKTMDPFMIAIQSGKTSIATTSTSSSITFKLVGPSVAYTPMDVNFLPSHKHYKEVTTGNTYDEIMAMIESGILPYLRLSNDYYCAILYLSSHNKSYERLTFTSYPFYNSLNEKADIYKYELVRNGSWVFKTLSFSATEIER